MNHIFRLNALSIKPGRCSACGEGRLIKWRDASTGYCYGDCCVEHAVWAAKALNRFMRAPTLEESRTFANR